MSQHKATPAGENFEQKLEKLRMRIDLLPAEQRPHLVELADAISQQRRRWQDKKSDNHDTN